MQSPDASALRRFIREGLGCSCPEEVLNEIEVERSPAAFADLEPEARLIKVGHRLLVLVVPCPDPQRMSRRLAEWFDRGRALRDRAGWNRFRLVAVADDPDGGCRALQPGFEELGLDRRLHLHVIAPRDLPDRL